MIVLAALVFLATGFAIAFYNTSQELIQARINNDYLLEEIKVLKKKLKRKSNVKDNPLRRRS